MLGSVTDTVVVVVNVLRNILTAVPVVVCIRFRKPVERTNGADVDGVVHAIVVVVGVFGGVATAVAIVIGERA